MLIIIPFPLFFAQTVYGVHGLTAWVVIGMIWAFCSAFAVVLYPLYESRAALLVITRGIVKARLFPTPPNSQIIPVRFRAYLGRVPQDVFARGGGKFVEPESKATTGVA